MHGFKHELLIETKGFLVFNFLYFVIIINVMGDE